MKFKNILSSKVYDLLIENNVKPEEVTNSLVYIYNDICECLWERVDLSINILYMLKDIVFYNLEHIPANGKESGVYDMKTFGSIYNCFLNCFNDSNVVSNKDLEPLLNDINSILSKWNKNWIYAELRSKNLYYGDAILDLPLIVYDEKTEKPSKYGYNKTYSGIVDLYGSKFKKQDEQSILCCLSGEIGEYSNATIMYNFLIELKMACNRALLNNKSLMVDFKDQY